MTEEASSKKRIAPLVAIGIVVVLVIAAAVWHFFPAKASVAQTLFKSDTPNIVAVEKMGESVDMNALDVDSSCTGYDELVASLSQEQATFKKDETGATIDGVVYTLWVESGSESFSVTFNALNEAHSNSDEKTYQLESSKLYDECAALYEAAETK